jgi:hypothetical protein
MDVHNNQEKAGQVMDPQKKSQRTTRRDVPRTKSAGTDTESQWTASMAAEDPKDQVVLYQGFFGLFDDEPEDAFIHSDAEEWHRDRKEAESDARQALEDMRLLVLAASDNSSGLVERLRSRQGNQSGGFAAYVVEGVADKAGDDSIDHPREFDVAHFRYHLVDHVSDGDLLKQIEEDLAS